LCPPKRFYVPPKQETRKTTIKKAKEPEKAGEAIKASDYSNADNWLAKPTEIISEFLALVLLR
jgi:hypothetical protein